MILELLLSLCICAIVLGTSFVIISNGNMVFKNVYISNEEIYQTENTMNIIGSLIKESSGIREIYETRETSSKNKVDENIEIEVGKIVFNTIDHKKLTIRKLNTEASVDALYCEEMKMILGENITGVKIKPKKGSFKDCNSILITMTSGIGEQKLSISNEISFKNR